MGNSNHTHRLQDGYRVPAGARKPNGLRPVLIAAGGTGGHVIPAQAVALALRNLHPEIPVEFVCGMRPVELRTYWNHSEHPYLLRCGKAPGTGLGGLRRWLQLLRVLAPARSLIAKLNPAVVLGMGGYIAAPILLAAWRRRIPIVLHESNAVAGRTTRLFSRWAREVLLTHEQAAAMLPRRVKSRVVGTPVRADLFGVTREQGAAQFQLDPNRPVVLVLGGSQGAKALNAAVLDSLAYFERMAGTSGSPQILWSTGAANHARLALATAALNLNHVQVSLHPMIHPMSAAYAAADLVVSRAGSGTLAEISALGLPSILVPYPHAKDDHQRHNARSLSAGGGATLVEEADLGPGVLGGMISRLLADGDGLHRMAAAARAMATPRAAQEVALALVRVGYENAKSLEMVKEPAHAAS